MSTKTVKECVPILICVYNRPKHLQRCVESLQANKLAPNTHLYVTIDAPYKVEHADAINEVIKYAKTITGFKEVTLFIREKNLGRNNIFFARDEIFLKYDSLIFMEDDNVVSTDFLSYMNQSLEIYKDREDVFSISGYNYPVNIPKSYPEEYYMWQGYSAWGVGIWRDKWNKMEWDTHKGLEIVRQFLRGYGDVYKLNKIANHYVPALILMLRIQRLNGDGYVPVYQFMNKMYSVFPVVSRVRNIGHDGSGVNCGTMEDDIYERQEIYQGSSDYQVKEILKSNVQMDKILFQHFSRKLKTQLKTCFELVLTNIGFNKSI
jgi:glycosyltransferase involved in cell wall biosynthesis